MYVSNCKQQLMMNPNLGHSKSRLKRDFATSTRERMWRVMPACRTLHGLGLSKKRGRNVYRFVDGNSLYYPGQQKHPQKRDFYATFRTWMESCEFLHRWVIFMTHETRKITIFDSTNNNALISSQSSKTMSFIALLVLKFTSQNHTDNKHAVSMNSIWCHYFVLLEYYILPTNYISI